MISQIFMLIKALKNVDIGLLLMATQFLLDIDYVKIVKIGDVKIGELVTSYCNLRKDPIAGQFFNFIL